MFSNSPSGVDGKTAWIAAQAVNGDGSDNLRLDMTGLTE